MNDIVSTLVEITLAKDEDFLKVRETLTRIGVASKKDNTLFQSCHILHKQGRYYIVHFKQLFMLDGKQTNFDEADKGRLNTIVALLAQWNLVTIVPKNGPDLIPEPLAPLSQIKVVPFKEKKDWNLVSKYTIGKVKTSS